MCRAQAKIKHDFAVYIASPVTLQMNLKLSFMQDNLWAALLCMCVSYLHDRWISWATAWAQVYVTEKQESRKSQSEQHRMCICSEQHCVS